jgi:hypothetical protein
VFLTNAPVAKPLQVFDDDDDRSLMEPGGIKEAQQPWDLGHPPQQTDRAVRGHVVCTLLLVALATASRLACERAATSGESVGWQRWRRQLLEQTREQVRVCAQGSSGIVPRADYSLLVGVQRKDRPPGLGTRRAILATYRLMTRH